MSRNFTVVQSITDRLIINDTAAFEELYYTYWHSLYVFGLRKLHFTEDARQLVRDIFMDVWDKRRQLPASVPLSEYLYEEGKKGIIKCLSKKITSENNLEINTEELVLKEQDLPASASKTIQISEKKDLFMTHGLNMLEHRKLVRYVNGEEVPPDNWKMKAWLSDTRPNTYLSPRVKKQLEKEILVEIQTATEYLLFFPKKEKPWWQKIAAMI